jgi:hypothetical protein
MLNTHLSLQMGHYHYEDMIYSTYLNPGKVSVPEEINILETDIEKAAAAGKPVPPGLHAHLAVLLVSNGEFDKALGHFRTEKELFPGIDSLY